MKKILLTTVAAVALSLSAFALAVSAQVKPVIYINNNSGAYVGIQAGIGGMDTKKSDANDFVDASASSVELKEELRNGIAGRIYGGYLFPINSKFSAGAELGYAMYPKNKDTLTLTFFDGIYAFNHTFKSRYVDLLGVAKYNITDNFNIFGKFGGAYVMQKFSVNTTINNADTSGYNVKNNKLLPEVAAGIGYSFAQNFSVDLTYAHVFGKSVDTGKVFTCEDDNKHVNVASVNTLMLGASYRF